jgi:hypothetical protein
VRARARNDDGVIFVVFVFAATVFLALVFGGIFIFSRDTAYTQTDSAVSAAAELAATGSLTSPQLGSCETNIPPLLDRDGNAPDQNTLTTICEIEEVLGGSAFGTEGGSLQVAIYCDASGAAVGTSGTPCGTAGNVWVCARSYDSNGYPGIIGASWVTAQQEESIPAGAPIEYSTFFPAPSSADSDATTLSCGQ